MTKRESIIRSPETRASLLVRLQDSQNEAAWHEFVELYEPLVLRVARASTLQDADARDITQQVLLIVSREIKNWQPHPQLGSFRKWLSRVTRNLAVNLLIHHQRHPRGTGDSNVRLLLEQEPDSNASETAIFDLQFRRVVFQKAAEKIKPRFEFNSWNAFWMSCVEHRPIPQVATALNMTRGAVYIARSRVMSKLREQVELIMNQYDV